MDKTRLFLTDDGSLTLRDEQTGELQHNRAGAYSEALINYVEAAAALERLRQQGEIRVLDVCFGLGYNSFVLINEALKRNSKGKIFIYAIEIDPEMLAYHSEVLRYRSFSSLRNLLDLEMLGSKRSLSLKCADLSVELTLQIGSIQSCLPVLKDEFDFVFHDPFSPKRAPELWTLEIFQHYRALLHEKSGCMLTYSSAYAVRGGMRAAGFRVMRTKALGGKSGGSIGLTGTRREGSLIVAEELSPYEEQKLKGRSGTPYSDLGFLLERDEIINLRNERMARRAL